MGSMGPPQNESSAPGHLGESVALASGLPAAYISADGLYRYDLLREWEVEGPDPQICWVMLNPSTADATQDDPTIRRCVGFSKAWGFGSLIVVNLFALRSTDPKALLSSDVSPIGPENDACIERAVWEADCVMAAWGTKGGYLNRAAKVTDLIVRTGRTIHCLARTKDGHPKHPLYVKGDVHPAVYRLGHFGSRGGSDG